MPSKVPPPPGSASRIGVALAGVATVVLLVGFGWAVVIGLNKAPNVVGALVTALGAVLAVVFGRLQEKRLDREQQRRERLAPMYEKLLEQAHPDPPQPGKRRKRGNDPTTFFRDLHRNLILYAPEPVVQAWTAWSTHEPADADDEDEDEDDPTYLYLWEDLMFAIRKDLGTSRGNLGRGDLLRIYIPGLTDAASAESSSRANRS